MRKRYHRHNPEYDIGGEIQDKIAEENKHWPKFELGPEPDFPGEDIYNS